jgi:hypothetical protein
VRAAAINDDCTHVLACYGAGFIWRFEFIPPASVNEEEGGGEEEEEAADSEKMEEA